MNPREIIQDFEKEFFPYHPGSPYEHPIQSITNIREAKGLERCCACVGEDIQSGVYYCGNLAYIVADIVKPEDMQGCIVAYCKFHKFRLNEHCKE